MPLEGNKVGKMLSGRAGKGKIRPPRRAIIRDPGENEFEINWNILQGALRDIHNQNSSALSFEQLYRASYKIVLKKKGHALFDKVREFEEQWFAETVMPKMRELITPHITGIALGNLPGTTANERRISGEKFLKGLVGQWRHHNTCMNMITDVLMYMDRTYCEETHHPSIFVTTMGLFRDHILRSKITMTSGEVAEMITFDILNAVLLDLINMERQGDVIDKLLIRQVVFMLEGLYETDAERETEKLYHTVFEVAFLKNSREFYQRECETLLRESDAGTWLRKVEKRLVEESDRCRTTISLYTAPKVTAVVDEELITSHLTHFIAMEGSGVKAMIENDRHDDLKLLFKLISRVDSNKDTLKNALQNRVVELGSDINKTIQDTNFAAPKEDANGAEGAVVTKNPMTASAQHTAAALKWVDEILLLKDKFDYMWKVCFEEDQVLSTALAQSFSDFINVFPRCSEYVSLYIDDHLKSGIKGKTEAEIDVILEKAVTIIRYIRDKDMFELYYSKHLARRLLLGKSESGDVERQMVTRLKQEVGSIFTRKLEGMFRDMTSGEELTAGYRAHMQQVGDSSDKRIDLTMAVLTSNWWKESITTGAKKDDDGPVRSCNWPPEIKRLQDSFTQFYLIEKRGRTLTWSGTQGSAELKCFFPKIPGKEGALGKDRRYDLSVPTYGMVVLLLFNSIGSASLSFEEIEQQTMIPKTELIKVLHTLSVIPKARVLHKEPISKKINPETDRFSFNASFVSKSLKIKAPTISGASKVEGEEERKATLATNDEERKHVVEACVVRIMKQRKVLEHTNLVTEVINQLSSSRFKPDVHMIKKRIEGLIDREYLERVDGAARPTYQYLA